MRVGGRGEEEGVIFIRRDLLNVGDDVVGLIAFYLLSTISLHLILGVLHVDGFGFYFGCCGFGGLLSSIWAWRVDPEMGFRRREGISTGLVDGDESITKLRVWTKLGWSGGIGPFQDIPYPSPRTLGMHGIKD